MPYYSRRRRSSRPSFLGAIVIALVVLVFFGHVLLHTTGNNLAARAGPDYPNAARVDGAGSSLVKAGLASRTGGVLHVKTAAVRKELASIRPLRAGWQGTYDRDAFGPAWADTDRNGCDQRNDVLRRDLSHVDVEAGTQGCVILSGVLHDRYTGKTIHFKRGETSSLAVQVDHLVPLSWAWQNGASKWSDKKRERFANDFANLTAVDGPTNQAKSDDGPADWMPPQRSYACVYVARFTYVTASYHLTIDPADRQKIGAVLDRCE